MDVKIEKSWKHVLQPEFDKGYFEELVHFLKTERTAGKIIFPVGSYIFNAFEHTPFENVKVVLLGQDPYHGDGQAHGLSFSVPQGVPFPPSLRNIFKELKSDLNIDPPFSGDLSSWAKQGVLLLNASLTVEKAQAGSHAKCGWQIFTDAVIKKISDAKENVVFILWGNFAKQKVSLIDSSKHCIIISAHPSPLSAHNGFFGSKPFSTTNNFLISKGENPINWKL